MFVARGAVYLKAHELGGKRGRLAVCCGLADDVAVGTRDCEANLLL